jgi:uncharacterized protein
VNVSTPRQFVPPRAWRIRAKDIMEAAQRAQAYVEDLTFEQFRADSRSIDAVSYAMLVIGEAANAIPEHVIASSPDIPWADVRGMRNRIAHDYFGVDLMVLWHTVNEDLPELRSAFEALLDRDDLT